MVRSRTPRVLVAVLAVVAALLLGACSVRGGSSSGGSSSGPTGDGVLWRSGTDAATVLDTYRRTPWNTDDADDPKAVPSPDVPGRTAVAYTVPGGGTRSELEPAYRSFREGDENWFGFALYLPKDFPVGTSDWQVVAQWKNSGDGSPPLSIQVHGGRFVLEGGEAIGEHWQRDIGPAKAGARTDLVLRVHFSSDPGDGAVDVSMDGKQVVSDYHPKGGTLYPDESSYLKTGLYRSSDIGDDGTVYYDDVVIASDETAASNLASSS
ncbi:polysaccharide lyase [Actinomycetospora endophytica]|uniref:Polysaccharide lyase n=1 Tax=Actinomycetospora endophytica TaxID=2291215 RepID=A0ABS8P1Z5_9PSEU|nr:polysaccharide lyase [Actinomycetospora endophytica]MCD2192272.1 polysaccharide lyase [Actinomycetospora endophytica]